MSVRAPVGDLNVADTEVAIGRGLAIVRGGTDALTDFLMLAIEAGVDELLARSGGGMFTSITKDGLASLPLVLPPLVVQRRVVDLVNAVDTAASEALRVAGVLGSVLEPLRSDATGGATTLALGELIHGIDGGHSPKTQGELADRGDRCVLKLSAVQAGEFVPSEAKALGAIAMPESALVQEGDVLITRSNTPEKVGFVCYAENVWPNTYLSDLTLRIAPDVTKVDPRYLVEVLNSRDARDQIIGSARGTSGSMRKINRHTIRDIQLPVLPLVEQREVTALLRSVRAVLIWARMEAQRLGDLRSALLGELLSGEREIPESYDDLVGLVA